MAAVKQKICKVTIALCAAALMLMLAVPGGLIPAARAQEDSAYSSSTYDWSGDGRAIDTTNLRTVYISSGASGVLRLERSLSSAVTITIKTQGDDPVSVSGASIVCASGVVLRFDGEISLEAPAGEAAITMNGRKSSSIELGAKAKVEITGGKGEDGAPAGNAVTCTSALGLEIYGEQELTLIGGEGEARGYGIYADGDITMDAGDTAALTISGGVHCGGKLALEAAGEAALKTGGLYAKGGVGLRLRKQAALEVVGDTLTGGINSGGAAAIELADGAALTAGVEGEGKAGTKGAVSHAIYAVGALDISLLDGAALDAAGGASGSGIYAGAGLNITAAGQSLLTAAGGASAGAGNGGHGIYAAGAAVVTAGDGATLSLSGGDGSGAMRSGGCGISCADNLELLLGKKAAFEAAAGNGLNKAGGGSGLAAGRKTSIITAQGPFSASGPELGQDGAGIRINGGAAVISAGSGGFAARGGALGHGIYVRAGMLDIEQGAVECDGAYGVYNMAGFAVKNGVTLKAGGSVFPLYHHRSTALELGEGTTLEFTGEGELSAKDGDFVRVRVTGPDVVIKGGDAKYTGLAVEVEYDEATITLSGISFAAAKRSPYPDGLSFKSVRGPHTVSVWGEVSIGGGAGTSGAGGYGIRSETELVLATARRSGDSLKVFGGGAATAGRDGGAGIYATGQPVQVESEGVAKVEVRGKIKVEIPLEATGGAGGLRGKGAAGIAAGTGVSISMKEPITAVGGDGGDGGPGISVGNNLTISAPVTAVGGAGLDGHGGDGIYVDGDVRVYAELAATGGDSTVQAQEYTAGVPIYMRDPAKQRLLILELGVSATLRDGALAFKTERYAFMLMRNRLGAETMFEVSPKDAIKLGNETSREFAMRTNEREAVTVKIVPREE